ncbi:hypothetical protein MPC4_10509 [Methylocella tundrae]|uniref:Uncharacterized protein n=1 Tax=Methylocella tundrae TaxID=227605 RepID=A0A8B6M2I2_METTU|nr:hypothetical protein MPC4_10509 [Methylocella tundrae]
MRDSESNYFWDYGDYTRTLSRPDVSRVPKPGLMFVGFVGPGQDQLTQAGRRDFPNMLAAGPDCVRLRRHEADVRSINECRGFAESGAPVQISRIRCELRLRGGRRSSRLALYRVARLAHAPA